LKCCQSAWVKPRTIFDIAALNAKIQDLEQLAAQPDFWDDQTSAQATLQELNDLKSNLQQYQEWRAKLEDAKAVLELLELEADTTLLEEAETNLTQLNHELDRWELEQLLSGPYDAKGAVLRSMRVLVGLMPKIGRRFYCECTPVGQRSTGTKCNWRNFLKGTKLGLSLSLSKLTGVTPMAT
jgi:hypothetical protein